MVHLDVTKMCADQQMSLELNLLQLNRTQFPSLGIFVIKKVGNQKNKTTFIMDQFFWVGLSSICFLSCLDSCLQTYVLKKIKTARFMLCLSQT